jgi:predicted PurR-regulated permease PerM
VSPTLEARLQRWRTTAYAAWAIIGILLLVAASGWVVGRIASALAPFVLAFLLVFFMQGPVNALARRGLPRGAAVSATFAVGFLVISLVVVFLIPPVSRQLIEFAKAAPYYLKQVEAFFAELQIRFSAVVIPDWLRVTFDSVSQSLSQLAVKLGNAVAQGILSAGSGIATVVFDVFLGLVVAFWALKDQPKIRTELRSLAGDKYEDDFENLLTTVVRVVGGYLKGQTVASLVTGSLAGIGLAIIGVPYALVLAIITFVFNYVPYVGPLMSGLIAAVVGAFVSPLTAVLAVAIVIGAQQVTDLFVTPRVMSAQVDQHPTLVIFSLLVGAALFGFWGMIFSIPVAATGKGLFVYYFERRTNRTLASEDGALFKSSQCDDDSEAECANTDESDDAGLSSETRGQGASK